MKAPDLVAVCVSIDYESVRERLDAPLHQYGQPGCKQWSVPKVPQGWHPFPAIWGIPSQAPRRPASIRQTRLREQRAPMSSEVH